MWGIASESFGSTYTKNDYLGKKVLSPVPRGVGCVCDVTCWWALLSLAAVVPLGSRGTIVMWGIASINFGSTYTKNDLPGEKGVESCPS